MAMEQYSISGDTLNGIVDAGSLHRQIEEVTGKLLGVSTDPSGGDVLYIEFSSNLTGPEKTLVDGVVAAHTGEAVDDFLDAETGWNITVEDRDLTSPPGSPQLEEYYIVGDSATGDWAARDGSIAQWNGSNWQFQIPAAGFAVYLRDETAVVVWDGSEWGDLSDGTPPSVFGTGFQSAQSLATSTTTSTSWQTKVKLSTSTLEAGTYLLLVSYGWSADTTSSDFEAQILQGETVLGQPHVQEPKESGGYNGSTGTDQRYYVSRHFVLNLSDSSYEYFLQHRTNVSGRESSTWDAVLTLWRVA